MELEKLIQEDLLKLSDLRNIKTTEIVISSNGKGGVIYVFMYLWVALKPLDT